MVEGGIDGSETHVAKDHGDIVYRTQPKACLQVHTAIPPFAAVHAPRKAARDDTPIDVTQASRKRTEFVGVIVSGRSYSQALWGDHRI